MAKRKASPQAIPPDVYPSFSPSVLCMLQRVVEEAWAELKAADSAFITPEHEQLTRELLAHRVMARAARGELDPQRLKEHAVWGMSRRKRRQTHEA
jgi:hypothetical protein